MVTKICEQCGEEFAAKRSTAKFCCEACKKKAKRARGRKEIECESCGQKFVPTHGSQIYCSDYCKEFEKLESRRLYQLYSTSSTDTWTDGDQYDY